MDIAITWNESTGRGDWSMTNGDLASGSDLQTAVLLSLFTDARVDDYVAPPPSGAPDRRGCWTDAYTGYQIGSRFWTRMRLVKNQFTLNLIQTDAQDALGWLISDGVVASFDIQAAWINKTMIGLSIVAHMPAGDPQTFRFQWVWGQIS
jgi:phage gp46-like protein